jgi:hypothetical protein
VRTSEVETLVINGALDVMAPPQLASRELMPHLPNGQEVILPGFGHTVSFLTQQPEAGTHLVNTFFDSGRVDTSRYGPEVLDFTPPATHGMYARVILAVDVTNEGTDGPVTGGFPSEDFLFVPSAVGWFSAIPTDATVDGRYVSPVDDVLTAGLWRNRDEAAAGAPIILSGTTTAGSRYLAYATDPFSRGDFERAWPLIGQAALWSNLTDEE